MKALVKLFNVVVNANVWCDEVPKGGVHYTCIACVTIDSVKNYPQVYLEEYKYKIKKKKMPKFIDAGLTSDSSFDSE